MPLTPLTLHEAEEDLTNVPDDATPESQEDVYDVPGVVVKSALT